MRAVPKFHSDRSKRCHDVAIFLFLFSKCRPSAILDLLHACLDYPQRVFAGLYYFAELGSNVGIDAVVLIICKF